MVLVTMSTAFFWDRGRKHFICERRAIGLESHDFGKDLTFVFNSRDSLIKLFKAEREEIIYDEHGVARTVDSLIHEISNRGAIIFVPNYFEG